MGWNTQAVIANLVIVEGAGDGLFVYTGTPAAGNLVASIASASGTDPFGNSYLAGVTSYQPGAGGIFSQLLNGAVNLGGTGVTPGQLLGGGSSLQITSGTNSDTPAYLNLLSSSHGSAAQTVVNTNGSGGNTSALLEVQGTAAAATVKAIIGTSLETWHTLSLNTPTWSAVAGHGISGNPSYRLNAVGNVELVGRVSGNTSTSTTIATLPAGYFSGTNAKDFAPSLVSSAGVNAGQSARLNLDTSGNITIAGLAGGAATVDIDGTFMLSAG